jgi:hypothetical protein
MKKDLELANTKLENTKTLRDSVADDSEKSKKDRDDLLEKN